MVVVDRGNKEIEDILSYVVMFQYLAFPCGLIRGALANLGVVCIVTAEVTMMPACELSQLLLIACILAAFLSVVTLFLHWEPHNQDDNPHLGNRGLYPVLCRDILPFVH